MRYKLLISLFLIATKAFSSGFNTGIDSTSTIQADTSQIRAQIDSIAEKPVVDKRVTDSIEYAKLDERFRELINQEYHIPEYIPDVKIDSLVLHSNPLLIDLVFMGYPGKFNSKPELNLRKMLFNKERSSLDSVSVIKTNRTSPEEDVLALRAGARRMITREAADLYYMSYQDLPDPNANRSTYIRQKQLEYLNTPGAVKSIELTKKINVTPPKPNPWTKIANLALQFSQNTITKNWYQGGNSNLTMLSVLAGKMNYDNSAGLQWENSGEWRMGFYAVNDAASQRFLNTNDDILKLYSKLGIKASENLYYSSSLEFSTQFFNNYKSYNSNVMKASLFTPVRINLGVGIDYKYKKSFSAMVAPVTYKYIYVNDTIHVSPNLFGIASNKTYLSEIGSSIKIQNTINPFRELQIDSKFNFYTNYKKVEIDWEVVALFTVNRFLSTRILLNPRYDNTVIGEKAGIQFKELMSFGLSYRLLR